MLMFLITSKAENISRLHHRGTTPWCAAYGPFVKVHTLKVSKYFPNN